MVRLLPTLDPSGRAALAFMARYRVATRPALATVVPDEVSLDRLLRSLLDARLVCTNRSLAQQRSVYQLTRRGTSGVGVSVALARRVGSQALIKHLAILCLCLETSGERVRLDGDETRRVLGTPAPEGVHVLAPESGQLRMLWCYVPGSATSIESMARRLRRHVYAVCDDPTLKHWVDDRRYGLAVIVSSDARRRAVERALRMGDRRGHPPIATLIAVWVYVPASFAELVGVAPAFPVRRSGPLPKDLWGEEASSVSPRHGRRRRARDAHPVSKTKKSNGRRSAGGGP